MLQVPVNKFRVAVDEVGRGCLAFDVCAAAVILPLGIPEDIDDKAKLSLIKDSKKLSSKKRQELVDFIKKYAIAWGIGVATPSEIDEMNILQATFLAMHRAIDDVYERLKNLGQGIEIDHILVDGDKFKPYMNPVTSNWMCHICCPRGDNIHVDVAAASILAKTYRDATIDSFIEKHPEWKEKYGFNTNKAYGTPKHIDGLKKYGPTQHHRLTFAPVSIFIHKD